jgi:hypothetical protein
MEFKFKGYIEPGNNGNFETIYLLEGRGILNGKIDLVKKFESISELYNTEVGVSFYVVNDKKADNDIQEQYLRQIVGGIEASFDDNTYYYSEWTFDDSSYDTTFRVGGHDLLRELNTYKGKWCVIKIKLGD